MNSIIIENFPYRSQTDNEIRPFGTCNVTSIAMCLLYHGIVGDNSYPQLEDQLTQRCWDNGWDRHDAEDLKRLAESFPGIRDNFTDRGTLTDIKQALTSGIPIVLHGYFTKSGHIIAASGFDEKGLIAQDPFGEWYEDGYDINDYNNPAKGKNIHYSWGMIRRLCSPESVGNPQHIWLHRISRTD